METPILNQIQGGIELIKKTVKETIDAIEEGRKLASDPNTKKYSSMDELRKAFDEI